MQKPYFILLLIFLNSFLLVVCSQPATTSNLPTTQIPPSPTQTNVVAAHTATPTATPTPAKILTTPEPTSTPSSPSKEPPATPTTGPPSSTNLDSYGFQLKIDGSIDIESSGLLEDQPRKEDGIVFFEYEGANSTLLWLRESKEDELLSDIYTQIVDAQPELTFSLINQGSIAVDSLAGSYLTFVSNSSTGEATGGGLTGVWECPSQTVYSLTVTGSDPVVLQIRFKRLLDGFTCN